MSWEEEARRYCQNAEYHREKREQAEARIEAALKELGVPGPGYPAPVANAVAILQGESLTGKLQGGRISSDGR